MVHAAGNVSCKLLDEPYLASRIIENKIVRAAYVYHAAPHGCCAPPYGVGVVILIVNNFIFRALDGHHLVRKGITDGLGVSEYREVLFIHFAVAVDIRSLELRVQDNRLVEFREVFRVHHAVPVEVGFFVIFFADHEGVPDFHGAPGFLAQVYAGDDLDVSPVAAAVHVVEFLRRVVNAIVIPILPRFPDIVFIIAVQVRKAVSLVVAPVIVRVEIRLRYPSLAFVKRAVAVEVDVSVPGVRPFKPDVHLFSRFLLGYKDRHAALYEHPFVAHHADVSLVFLVDVQFQDVHRDHVRHAVPVQVLKRFVGARYIRAVPIVHAVIVRILVRFALRHGKRLVRARRDAEVVIAAFRNRYLVGKAVLVLVGRLLRNPGPPDLLEEKSVARGDHFVTLFHAAHRLEYDIPVGGVPIAVPVDVAFRYDHCYLPEHLEVLLVGHAAGGVKIAVHSFVKNIVKLTQAVIILEVHDTVLVDVGPAHLLLSELVREKEIRHGFLYYRFVKVRQHVKFTCRVLGVAFAENVIVLEPRGIDTLRHVQYVEYAVVIAVQELEELHCHFQVSHQPEDDIILVAALLELEEYVVKPPPVRPLAGDRRADYLVRVQVEHPHRVERIYVELLYFVVPVDVRRLVEFLYLLEAHYIFQSFGIGVVHNAVFVHVFYGVERFSHQVAVVPVDVAVFVHIHLFRGRRPGSYLIIDEPGKQRDVLEVHDIVAVEVRA